jgi:hypothetical protein
MKIRDPSQEEPINKCLDQFKDVLRDQINSQVDTDRSSIFKCQVSLYKVYLDLGENAHAQQILQEIVHCADSLFSEEASSKKDYLHLLGFILTSRIYSEELALTFAKHFNKFQFRYGFHYEEIGKRINRYFLQYNYKR